MTDQRVDEGPQTFDELIAELRARHDTLSQAHRKLSERVMADPEAVAFMTVSELAAAVGVNEATVVRFANALGLKGYPGLTRLCRERLQEQAQLLRRFDTLERLPADGGGLLERTLGFDQANIARTFARIDDATWDAAVRHLTDAPRVHVMGLRKCHAPAYLLAYLLGMVREEVALVTAAAGALTDDLRRVRAGDCFVAVSIHRYMADTVRGARWARSVGAHVIALTDNPGSPLAATADECFFVDAAGPSVLRSMTAFTSLVQALTAGVAKSHGREARASLLQEERLLGDFQVYTTDSNS
ncbi:MurR/RpiR family transcriptional regulator [Nocardia blacklockiae]|uniref:MurR/RpiR family transcriptional regulator n=1 Tax=Nocardia blacklockiae TaxID=480036 RepID=UPI002B4B0EAC|nr:MurR/RpiR family transcriptional regulator [Nocardia blacklockiae]